MSEDLFFYYPEGIPDLPEYEGNSLKKAVETRILDNDLIFIAGIPAELGVPGEIDQHLSNILIEARMMLSMAVNTNVPQQELLLANLHFRRIFPPIPTQDSKSVIIGSELRDLVVIAEVDGQLKLTAGSFKPEKVYAIPLAFFRNNTSFTQEDLMKNGCLVPVHWVNDVNRLEDLGIKGFLDIIEKTK